MIMERNYVLLLIDWCLEMAFGLNKYKELQRINLPNFESTRVILCL